MIYQTDIYTDKANISDVYSEMAVKIHGAVMKAIPQDYSRKMHTPSYHPFSIFVVPIENDFIIRVSALCDEAKIIPETLARKKSLRIYGMKNPLKILKSESAKPLDAEKAYNYISRKGCVITFITPATIKTKGRFSATPDISAYFYSTVCKYNEFEKEKISYDEFKEAFSCAVLEEYQLGSVKYNVSGNIISGMTGYCRILFPKDEEQNILLRKVIAYASYSGIGGKTSMGMGGIIVQDIQ